MNPDEIYLGAIKRAKAELKRRMLVSFLFSIGWGVLLALIYTFADYWQVPLLLGWFLFCFGSAMLLMLWMAEARDTLEKAEEDWDRKLWSHGLLR